MTDSLRVILIEDIDSKAKDVEEVLNGFCQLKLLSCKTTRAANMVEAEDLLETSDWDLVLLDITMNITDATSSNIDGNQANLGGLELAETMYLTRREFPTISITGFDYFKMIGSDSQDNSFLYLDQLRERLENLLGENLVGTVRYGNDAWKEEFLESLEGWNQSLSAPPVP